MKGKKLVKTAVPMMLAFGLIAGCGGGGSSSGTGTDNGKKADGPTPISFTTILNNGEPPDLNGPVYKEVEKRTNTKLDIKVIPSTSYGDKFNLALSSNELTDIMLIEDPFGATTVNAIRQGAFMDLTTLLGDFKKYPNLANIPKDIWENSKVDGKIYGVPRPRSLADHTIYIRKDWLDKLNLKMPTTTDDFYNVMKAFVEQDPDGNGKADTFGYAGIGPSMSIVGPQLSVAFGAYKPTFEGDKMLLSWMTKGYRDYLEYARKMYAIKALPQEYSVLKEDKLTAAGKVGAPASNFLNLWRFQEDTRKADPKAELVNVPPLKGPDGYASIKFSGYYGILAISAKTPKDKIEKLLQYLDQAASPELNELNYYGVEGIHYTKENGKIKVNEEATKKDPFLNALIVTGIYDKYAKAVNLSAPDEINERQKKMVDEYMAVATPSPTLGLISDTNAKRGADLFKDRDTVMTKVITGQSPIEEWDAYVNKMKADPDVQKIMKEYADQYKLKNPDKK
ncbi:hypothetical protein [Paenibacillus sp. MBLB4367]|uniref:hypothetical protein n=1 Tax=Paenibacillus sp. MBLB4367 TaxID=3384767 RepID=UPI0039082D98